MFAQQIEATRWTVRIGKCWLCVVADSWFDAIKNALNVVELNK